MNESLRKESERLARSWRQHEPAWLRDYLMAGVEDPRVNVQSILTRHFLVRGICGERLHFNVLMEHEYRFAVAMNWLLSLGGQLSENEELEAILFGLGRGADDVEGIQIPGWVLRIFRALPAIVGSSADDAAAAEAVPVEVPNYIESFLRRSRMVDGRLEAEAGSLNSFETAWRNALRIRPAGQEEKGETSLSATPSSDGTESRISVLEPACGSANDFRFVETYGIARFIDYTGFDLCATNVANAQAMFPSVHFHTANVFEIPAPDKAFDVCIVHDLFEHLSFEGLETAVAEICRVTRHGICAGFFQMDEIPEHKLRPVDDYHWNLLSMRRTKELFSRHGFEAQVFHIGRFLRETTGCDRTHNPNAYTFVLKSRKGPAT